MYYRKACTMIKGSATWMTLLYMSIKETCPGNYLTFMLRVSNYSFVWVFSFEVYNKIMPTIIRIIIDLMASASTKKTIVVLVIVISIMFFLKS